MANTTEKSNRGSRAPQQGRANQPGHESRSVVKRTLPRSKAASGSSASSASTRRVSTGRRQKRTSDKRLASKKEICLGLLGRRSGATIDELAEATGWQSHSVRGFLSGVVRKRLARELTSEKDEKGRRRYRVVGSA